MLPSWCTQTITIIKPGEKTQRGSTVPDWDHPVSSTDIGGCSVQPATTSLSQDGRVLGILDGMTAYIPQGTNVEAGDHVVFNGNTYEIDGEPRVWQSATGARDHIQLNLKRYAG